MPRDFGRQRLKSCARVLALVAAAIAIPPSFCFAQSNAKPAPVTARPVKPETPHFEFVNEYIRELSSVERIRAEGEEETNEDTKDGKLPFLSMIHTSTLFELELGSQVKMLKGMHISGTAFDDLIPSITTVYEEKIAVWRRMKEIASAFIGGPKDGVDYDKLAAEMPQLRAQLEYLDQTIRR